MNRHSCEHCHKATCVMCNAERQAQYDRLLTHFVGTTDLPTEFRQSRACALLHDRIVGIIEGREVVET